LEAAIDPTAAPASSLRARLAAPVDIASLVAFRIAFGLLMVWDVSLYVARGWVERYFIEPRFLFKYYGFAWVEPWPGIGMHLHFAVMGAAAACIAAGLFYRAACVVFFLAFAHFFLLDVTLYLNHYYLITLISFLMILLPAHRAFSLDAWRRPELRARSAPAWALWLLRFQIGVPYFFGGVAKLNGDWLRGEPLRLWLSRETDFPVIGRYFTEEWMVYFFSWGGMLFDLCVVPLLLWRRTRVPALIVAVLFHLANARLFHIGVFPWLMIAATLMFLPPDWPRRLLRAGKAASAAAGPRLAAAAGGRVPLAFLTAWVAVQVLIPLRLHLYPGNPLWTREGYRFSWTMRLHERTGSTTLIAVDRAAKQFWLIDPREFLADHQLSEVASHPDTLLQFCHIVADEYRRAGREIEIYAESLQSLNGREPQRLIDPKVDLAVQQDSLLPARWMLPLEQPFRQRGAGRGGS
jgi:hypothetical protein